MTKRSAFGVVFGLGLVGSMILAGCGSGGGANGGTGSGGTPANTATGGAKGGSSAGGAVQKTDGTFVMLKLPFNEQVFGVSGQACAGPCFDQGGYTLDPSDPAWPNKGKAGEAAVNKIDVWFPGTTGKTGMNFGPEEGGKVTVNADGKAHKNMYVITAAGNGPGTADITFNYADGSKDSATMTVDDWCSTSPTGGVAAWTPADRMDPSGNQASPACGTFLDTVPIPGASKPLKSIDFANDSNNGSNFEPEVLAITLQ